MGCGCSWQVKEKHQSSHQMLNWRLCKKQDANTHAHRSHNMHICTRAHTHTHTHTGMAADPVWKPALTSLLGSLMVTAMQTPRAGALPTPLAHAPKRLTRIQICPLATPLLGLHETLAAGGYTLSWHVSMAVSGCTLSWHVSMAASWCTHFWHVSSNIAQM